MSLKRYIADKMGEFAGGLFRLRDSSAVLPASLVRREIDRLNNPLVVPADMLPASTRAGEGDGRAVHYRVADRRKVPLNPGEGKICEDCAHFRYEAGQELVRANTAAIAEAVVTGLGSRGPALEDLGLCAKDDKLCSRFAGSVVETQAARRDGEWVDEPVRDELGNLQFKYECPWYRLATEVSSTADPRRGRAFRPLGADYGR